MFQPNPELEVDTFARDVYRAMNVACYGGEECGSLMSAAAEVLLINADPVDYPNASNGRLRFAAFVPAPRNHCGFCNIAVPGRAHSPCRRCGACPDCQE